MQLNTATRRTAVAPVITVVAALWKLTIDLLPASSSARRRRDPGRRVRAAYQQARSDGVPGLYFLERDVQRFLTDRERLAELVTRHGRDPEELVYTVLANAAWERLHGRGCRAPGGALNHQGRQLLAAFTVCLERLRAHGHIDEPTHRSARAAIEHDTRTRVH